MVNGSQDEVLSGFDGVYKVGILSHEKPDGDALGASLALARILNENGFAAHLVGFHPFSPRYHFMVNDEEIANPSEGWFDDIDALAILDCGDLERAGAFALEVADKIKIINIDHHVTNDLFGNFNWVDSAASSAGEMVYRLARHAGWRFPVTAAEPLWVAITTDTGDFNYSNTSSSVLRIAADLIEMGVKPHIIRKDLHEKVEKKELELFAQILKSLELFYESQVALMHCTRDDFLKFGCTPFHLRDPVNVALSLDGARVAIFIYEIPNDNTVKVSMRSYQPFDSAEFCGRFAGGGHPCAAGCSFSGLSALEVKDKVISALKDSFPS